MSFQPTHPREVNRTEIRNALRSSFPANDEQQLAEYGDGLLAIAEALDIPMESLKFWIHDKPAGKEFTLSAWRTWCSRYSDARDQLAPEAAAVLPAVPEAAERPREALCGHCFAHVAQLIDGHWWCQRCGVVQL